MKKRMIAGTLIFIIVILAIAIWLVNKDKKLDQDLTLFGNVDIRQVSLAFEQAGRIQTLSVQEGDKVKKGGAVGNYKNRCLKDSRAASGSTA